MSIDRTGTVDDDRHAAGVRTARGDRAADAARSHSVPTRSTAEAFPRPLRRNRRRPKRRLVPLLLLVAVVGGPVAWWWYANRSSGATESPRSTATVARHDFSSSVLATGAIRAQVGAEVRVGARISGKVERLYANIGDPVVKGQVVAEIEKADLEALVAQRRAELDLAEAKLAAVASLLPKEIEKARLDLEECQATHTLAEKALGRARRLRETDAVSLDDLDQAEERHGVSTARLASARKALELAETRYAEDLRQARAEVARAASAVENAEVQLSYATITAPIDGVIASVSTEEGETVAAGMQAPTFVTIIDLDRLQVDAYVDEVDIGKVKVGQRAAFTVDAFPAMEFEGKVSAIYPKAIIQDNVVNYDVVIDVETPYEGLLRPEMTASVTIFLEKREGVLAVPAGAVQRERGRTVVYVLAEGRAEPREIKVGWRDGEWIEVAAGLEEGETLLRDARGREQPKDQELP
jgi:multidrug efflux pump subunit AcrA (membrane-fusion protein)